jgi:hypothetical protein
MVELVYNGTDMNQIIHRRGGVCPPEYIHDYTIRNVIGRADPAPTGIDSKPFQNELLHQNRKN